MSFFQGSVAPMSMYSTPVFRPFDPDGELRIYWRSLPHWRQVGATYFVTFRLGDSIPKAVMNAWRREERQWLEQNGLDPQWKRTQPHRFREAYEQIPTGTRRIYERRAARMLHDELDKGHGCCVLAQSHPREIVRKALSHFHGQRLWLGDFVIMPNHVHAIMIPFTTPADETSFELEDVLASTKKWSSHQIGDWQEAPPQTASPLWQQESYDRIIRDAEELATFRRYICRNPSAAKLTAHQYTYHAASWLDGFSRCDDP